MIAPLETQVGIQNLANMARPTIRSDRTGAVVTVDTHARFQEAVIQGNVYGFTGVATATAAAQIVGGAAGGHLNFAIWNPVGSGKNLVLWVFGMGIISGTPTAGPAWHGMMNTSNVSAVSSVAAGLGPYNLNGSFSKSVANVWFVAADTTNFTGGGAPYQVCMANFSMANTNTNTLANPNYTNDFIDGKIIIPQGMGWLPLRAGTGSSDNTAYSIVWEEIAA